MFEIEEDIMKKMLFALALISFGALAQDHAGLLSDFKSMIPKSGLSPLAEQAYCYQDQSGIHGYQVDKLQRIASVTKLLSTYFASQTLDLNKTFDTKIFILGDRLHIAGARDPYFEEEKLLLLMQALNDLGYKTFKSITFDSQFHFYDVALEAHLNVTPVITQDRLKTYFSGKAQALIKEKWLTAVNFAKEEGIELNPRQIPSLTATTVGISEVNPLSQLNATVFIHKSRPFHDLLKAMNVMSKNYVAQNVYNEAAQIKSFDQVMAEAGIEKSSYQIHTGSGLPIKTASNRLDNLASCRMVTKVIELLMKSLKAHNLELSDVVAVNGGKDLGSFRTRFMNQPETHQAVISKTGTLMHASTLAGVLLIDGKIPFGVLNQTTSVGSARTFQDQFVARMFFHLGEPTPMDYTKISIFPWDGTDFLEAAD